MIEDRDRMAVPARRTRNAAARHDRVQITGSALGGQKQ